MVHFGPARKPGNIQAHEIETGDLLRIETDAFNLVPGEKATTRILITSVLVGETNLHTSFYTFKGVDLATNQKCSKFYDTSRMELFLEAKCDPPSKK
jgi:formate-dependent phosphoribosylglycinamide formyltransferase (GAR transformylase)